MGENKLSASSYIFLLDQQSTDSAGLPTTTSSSSINSSGHLQLPPFGPSFLLRLRSHLGIGSHRIASHRIAPILILSDCHRRRLPVPLHLFDLWHAHAAPRCKRRLFVLGDKGGSVRHSISQSVSHSTCRYAVRHSRPLLECPNAR